jgi:hypothetical protein
MGWILFILGMMVGGTVGVSVMCLLFLARETEIQANLTE